MRKLVILLPLCFILPRFGYGTDGLLYAECIADVLALPSSLRFLFGISIHAQNRLTVRPYT